MFQHLVECCTDLQLILNISCLHLHFEHATHNFVRAIWSGIDIKGCHNLGGGQCRALAWLLDKIFLLLQLLGSQRCFAFILFPCASNVEKTHEFADYILPNYIYEHSKFPPSAWAEPDLQFKRITNGCESFMQSLRACFITVIRQFLNSWKDLKVYKPITI